MAKTDIAALLAANPALAANVAKIAQRRQTGQVSLVRTGRPSRINRPIQGMPTKKVKGGKGYDSYLTVDWAKVASRPSLDLLDKPDVIVSSGRNRRRRAA